MHDSLARLLAERRLEILAIVRREVVAGNGLAAVLVDALQNLVARGIAQAGEERDKLAAGRSTGCVPEDDLVQLTSTRDLPTLSELSTISDSDGQGTIVAAHLRLVAHQALRDRINLQWVSTPVHCARPIVEGRPLPDGRWPAQQYQRNLFASVVVTGR